MAFELALGSVQPSIGLRSMENLGDPDLPLEDEVERTVVSHTEAVQGRVIVPPYQANVGAGSRLDRILIEHAKLFLDAFREGTRKSSELGAALSWRPEPRNLQAW